MNDNFSSSFKRKLFAVVDAIDGLYCESTPVAQRTATNMWDVMTKAQDKMIKGILAQNFKKYISVAISNNDNDFFHKVPFIPS